MAWLVTLIHGTVGQTEPNFTWVGNVSVRLLFVIVVMLPFLTTL